MSRVRIARQYQRERLLWLLRLSIRSWRSR